MRMSAPVLRPLRFLTCSVVFVGFAYSAPCWTTDLLTFCLDPPPAASDPRLPTYNAQCPAFLNAQFQDTMTSAQATTVSTRLAQQKAQADLLTAYQGLVKPPASQVTSGVDIAGLGIAAVKRDAEMTFDAARTIGSKVKAKLVADNKDKKAIIVTAADLLVLLQLPAEAETVRKTIDASSKELTKVNCVQPQPEQAASDPLTLGLLGIEVLMSTIATAASAFQPSLVAAAKVSGVTDPQHIMTAGVIAGLGENKDLVYVHPPAITTTNSVVVAVGILRAEIGAANVRLAKCPKDPNIAESSAKIKGAKDLLTFLTTTDGTKPSLLDVAARRAALKEAGIEYTLFMTRDITGGGIAAVKPNWFTSTKLLMGAASGITYDLSDLNGQAALVGLEVATPWVETCGIDQWTSAFTGCKKDP